MFFSNATRSDRNAPDRSLRRQLAITSAAAAAGLLFAASPASAEPEFHRAFEREMGRIFAHHVAAIGQLAIFGPPLATRVIYEREVVHHQHHHHHVHSRHCRHWHDGYDRRARHHRHERYDRHSRYDRHDRYDRRGRHERVDHERDRHRRNERRSDRRTDRSGRRFDH